MQPVENNQQQHAIVARRRSFPWGLLVLLLVLVLVIGGTAFGKKSGMMGGIRPDKNLYQAVFLTNGQVYFGKIDKLTEDNLVMKDIYYLQVVQPLQQQGDGTQPAGQQQVQQGQQQQQGESALNLVKMGSEIHGPTDMMVIPMNNVVFWEDIKNDGTVAKAIEEFKAQPKDQQQGQQSEQK